MLKIRLRRMGSTHHPFYRVVVSDSRRTPTASALEEVGYYNPRKEPSVVSLDLERIEYWRSRGAQLSDAVAKLVKQGATVHVEPTGVPTETVAPAETEASPAEAAKPAAAETEKAEAEAEKAEPEAEKAEAVAAETKKAEAEPEAEKAEPEAEKAEPEAEKAEDSTEAASA